MKKPRMTDIVTLKIYPETRDVIDEIAMQRHVSMSELIREYIEEGIRREGL